MSAPSASAEYVELHCHSYFSLLDGASSPETLLNRAFELGMPGLALTDHDAVYGAVQFGETATELGVQPILGTELTLVGGYHLTLLVENETGWGNLCWLISQGRANAPKGQAALPFKLLTGHTDGLIGLSGCRQGEIPTALLHKDWHAAVNATEHYLDLFDADHFWLELQNHALPGTDQLIYKLVTLAERFCLGYVATNNVHYVTPEAHELQDILVCIRNNTTLEASVALRRPNSEYYLKSARQMSALFADYPKAISNTLRIAERCHFSLEYGLQELPAFPVPETFNADGYLQAVCEEGLRKRFSEVPSRAREMLAHELALIQRAGLANYFLIVWDIVCFAREQGIRCQGRGSSANSLVAYLLRISPVNPLAHDLVFERFLSDERRSTPDIDIDFQADRREEVIQYIYTRYGSDHAAMACTLVTFQSRSARREVGKALGLPPEVIDLSAREIHARNPGGLGQRKRSEQIRVVGESTWAQFERLSHQIIGLPRHLGIHNGGMIIMGSPLAGRVPTEPASMPGRVVVQWDKRALEDAGLIKIDILGLRMLSAVAETVNTIQANTRTTLDLDLLTFDDPAVYDLIVRADTIGVFQVESRAQAQVLPRLKPRKFEDLIVSISLIRPGPVQGNMVNPYLRRRLGEEPVTYAHRLLEPALAETLGVILFQEQVLKVARDLGQFTPGKGEQLRRALGSKSAATDVAQFQAEFMTGALNNGVSQDIAAEIFSQLKAFGGYSFPKSHAAAFAVLVYQSAWLKCHYPAEFYTALLNHQPMGFWSPAVIVNDARHHGIRILSVDINLSQARCLIEDGGIRMGLKYVHGLGENGSARIEQARGTFPYTDLMDFCQRTQLPPKLVENLILVGAMDRWGKARRQLLWELGQVRYDMAELDLGFEVEEVNLPGLSRADVLRAEYLLLGLSTGDHVMALYRSRLTEQDILSSQELAHRLNGERVRVAGQVVVHQAPPTAKGHHFITLEDEDGLINVIVRPDIVTQTKTLPVWQGFGLNGWGLILVEGIVQHRGEVINVVAYRILPLIANALTT